MKHRLRIKRGARADAREARGWYEREAPHMISEFDAELAAVLRNIEERPLVYPKIHGEARRALVNRFPYAIFFVIEEDRVVVFAISHQSQSEERWQNRT